MADDLKLEQITGSSLVGRQKYTNAEAVSKSLEYFKGDEFAATIFAGKYALKDSFGNLYETSPVDMHNRLTREFARIENKYKNPLSQEEIFSRLDHFKYIIPQGGPMSGIGNDDQIVSLSNCFVIGSDGLSDSYGGIMNVDQEQVQLMKRRGGVGHDLSHIRPKGQPVKNSALTSTGVVPFMERYSNSTHEVAQDGRRGALMLSISVKHPDAERFIDAKLEEGKVNDANISVKLTDDFMQAVLENRDFVQQYPINSDNPKVKKTIKAKTLYDKIIHNAWKSAEPGVLFWDTIIRESIPDRYADLGFGTVSTNPCGEIPLCPYDSCRLLAINLFGYVKNPFTKEAKFDWELYKKDVRIAQRISDDIIDLEMEKIDAILIKIETDPEPDNLKRVERELWQNIKQKAKEGRRHGLGITAEGDMLAGLGLTYGTEEATKFATEVQKTLAIEAYRSSVELAKERGAFEIYDAKREESNPFIQRIKEADPVLYADMVKHGRRNIALLTIAPTGTTSLMSQTTSGIEPVFAPTYKRRRKVNPNDKNVKIVDTDTSGNSWEEYNVYHHKFEDWLKINGYNPEEVRAYSDEKLEELVKKSPYHKATANDVDWIQKVKMQGEIQKWVDHSISVTINLPKGTKEELVSELYLTAWKSGCKGATVYIDGTRKGILSTGKNDKTPSDSDKQLALIEKHPMLREEPFSHTYSIPTGEGKLYITITGDEKGFPQKIFENLGPVGSSKSSAAAIDGMRLSRYLEEALDPDLIQIYKDYGSAKSDTPVGLGPNRVDSLQHGFAIAMLYDSMVRGIITKESGMIEQKVHKVRDENGNGKAKAKKLSEIPNDYGVCPECGGRDMKPPSDGCKDPSCRTCGHSKCG